MAARPRRTLPTGSPVRGFLAAAVSLTSRLRRTILRDPWKLGTVDGPASGPPPAGEGSSAGAFRVLPQHMGHAMFESLSSRLRGAFEGLTRRGALTEASVDEALVEVRRALLDADVALPVARQFVARVREKAVGQAVLGSVSPGQQVVKIVHDELVEALGGTETAPMRIDSPPAIILMVGLQGSGKTTTSAKLAKHLAGRQDKKVLLAALDTRRPAAMEQLATLGLRAGIDTLPIVPGEDAVAIARRGADAAQRGGYDVAILDTAGRMAVDDALMAESAAVRDASSPRETLLVADSLTGQDAVRVAEAFDRTLGLTGVILTRLDGDGRGGAALSMRAATGKPIRFAGVGEGIDDLEAFRPERIASRIVGMGDVVSLVEQAQEKFQDEDERTAQRIAKGRFDMNDFRRQLQGLERMGGMAGILDKLPGMDALKGRMRPDMNVGRQIAMICSMTEQERRRPEILQASRRRRIAAGSGTDVAEVNRLVKAHLNFAGMIRHAARNGGGAGGLEGTLQQIMAGGGAPPAGLRRKPRRRLR